VKIQVAVCWVVTPCSDVTNVLEAQNTATRRVSTFRSKKNEQKILQEEEFHDFYYSFNIIRVIRSRPDTQFGWDNHETSANFGGWVCECVWGRGALGKQQLVRVRRICETNIKMDLRKWILTVSEIQCQQSRF